MKELFRCVVNIVINIEIVWFFEIFVCLYLVCGGWVGFEGGFVWVYLGMGC